MKPKVISNFQNRLLKPPDESSDKSSALPVWKTFPTKLFGGFLGWMCLWQEKGFS